MLPPVSGISVDGLKVNVAAALAPATRTLAPTWNVTPTTDVASIFLKKDKMTKKKQHLKRDKLGIFPRWRLRESSVKKIARFFQLLRFDVDIVCCMKSNPNLQEQATLPKKVVK